MNETNKINHRHKVGIYIMNKFCRLSLSLALEIVSSCDMQSNGVCFFKLISNVTVNKVYVVVGESLNGIIRKVKNNKRSDGERNLG